MTRLTAKVVSRVAAALLAASAAGFVAAQGPAPHRTGDGWALGYGVAVARACRGWQMVPQPVLAARGILPQPVPLGEGPFQRSFYRGQGDATADRRRHRHFCRVLVTVAGARWQRLAPVLRRATAP